MKKVVIFGAAGLTGSYITRAMRAARDIEVTAFVRDPCKFGPGETEGVNVVVGDATDAEAVRGVLKGQDILLCSLDGDILPMAQNIVACLASSSVTRVVWITGMGIHHEVKGPRGAMLAMYAKKRPEYIEAADLIAACGASTTLLRCPSIQNGDNTAYELTREGEQPRNLPVDRAAIAQCMADIVADESLGAGESLGITNAA